MAIKNGTVALTTDPTLIRAVLTTGTYVGLQLYNGSTDTVYIGSSGVTTGNGRPFAPGDGLSLLLWPVNGSYAADALYGTSTGSVSVYYLCNRDAT